MGKSAQVRSGVSMIEVIVSTLLVATVLIVSLTASSNLVRNDVQNITAVDGKLLANFFIDEITSLAFEDQDSVPVFGSEPDETTTSRITLDDVDDYQGLNVSPPTDRSGLTLSEFAGWSVAITVTPAEPTADGFTSVPETTASLRRIVVVCTSATGQTETVEAIVSNVGDTSDRTLLHQRRREISLQFPQGGVIRVDVPLRNYPLVSGS